MAPEDRCLDAPSAGRRAVNIEDDLLAEAYNRGLDLEKAGKLTDAAAAYREVLRLDPSDHGGAAVRLAAMGAGPVPEKAPDAYVATLFDQCADVFDDILVERLGYAVPMLVRQRLAEIAPGPYDQMLDLGCGTGLTGDTLADMAGTITGLDLAEGMLEVAGERETYDHLFLGEAVAFLDQAKAGEFDLVTATDVLPYIGALEPFCRGLGHALRDSGVTALSAETFAETADSPDFTVGPKHRFAHALPYLQNCLKSEGLSILEQSSITVRYEEGAPVPGCLILARKN